MSQLEQLREQCAKACMTASADKAAIRAIGDAAHYAACAKAIRALPLPDAKALNQRISTLETENELLQTQIHCAEAINEKHKNEKVRSLLEKLAKLGNGDIYGNSVGNQLAIEALNHLRGDTKMVNCREILGSSDHSEDVRAMVGEWISVKDRLPEEYSVVCLLNENMTMNTGVDRFNPAWHGTGYLAECGYGYWHVFGERRGISLDFVTHWMPLPPAPEVSP